MMKASDNPLIRLGETLVEAIRQAVREEIQGALSGERNQARSADQAKSYLTVKKAALTSGLGCSTIRLYIRKRQLGARRVGRRVLVKRVDLEKFLETNPIEAIKL